MKIRTWDTVELISGKGKGTQWKVLRVFTSTEKILVEWANIATRHVKKMGTTPGQIVKIEKPVHVSTVMLVCPITNKKTRVGYTKVEEKGKTKKFRFSKVAVKEWKKLTDAIIK